MWTELSDTAILRKLGERIKTQRLNMGMKQSEVAEESGIGLNTVGKIESGKSVSAILLISVLRTLNLLENLEMLVPVSRISPVVLMKLQRNKVQRIR